MSIKKTNLVLVLSGALFCSLPMSQAFAHEKHCEIEDTELGDLMKYMKSELRGYTKGFKSDDQEKMQKHLNELIKLSEKAHQLVPVTISKPNHTDSTKVNNVKVNKKGMDDSKIDMKEMDHDMATMPSMEGMSLEQHHQHLKYMQGMEELQALLQALNETKNKTKIKTILVNIKEHQKKNHKKFRQDCS